MNVLVAAGIIAIVGSVVFLVTPFVTSRGLYEMSAAQRMEFVQANPATIRAQNTLLSIGGIMPALGYLLWTTAFRDQGPPWLRLLAAASFLIGAVFLAVFFYQQYKDPGSYYLAEKMTWPGVAYYVLTVVAFGLYGILFLRTESPNWLGYVSIVVAAGMLVGLWRIGGKDLPPQPFYLVTLVAGIVFLIG